MAALLAAPAVLFAQSAAAGPLEFLGFRPGASRAELEDGLAAVRGAWRCSASRVDRRFTECRGTLEDPGGGTIAITASLVRDSAAILLLRATTDSTGASHLARDLSARFGRVSPRMDRGGQMTWQWVRQGRMLRLSTRPESGAITASLSLVDGRILDGLGSIPRRP